MTTRQRLLKGLVLAVAGLGLFLVCIYIFLPSERINSTINQVLAGQGLLLSPAGHKTLLPGLAWDNLQLSSEQGALVRCERLKVRLLLLPLLTGRATLKGAASIGAGQLKADIGLTGKQALDLQAQGINLADIPFFKTVLGARMGGSLRSEGLVKRGPKGLNGELKLEVRQLEFSGVKLGAFPLPDVSKLSSQGMVRVTNNRIRLESFTLQGDGIYMRLSGDIPSGANAINLPLNLSLEIMPKPDFLEKQKLVFLLLAKFMVSPGVYQVPVKGTLLNPLIL
ncbi:MAG TPA: type II secretion system protein GspN [Desulfuromonadaceae bacterium]|jgi:type II secretion system protein N